MVSYIVLKLINASKRLMKHSILKLLKLQTGRFPSTPQRGTLNFSYVRKAVIAVGAVLLMIDHAATADLQRKPRMTKEEVITIARRAIEARFPWTADKHYHYYAIFHPDGIWGVGVPHKPSRVGGGDPIAEVRDSDGKVMNVYFAK